MLTAINCLKTQDSNGNEVFINRDRINFFMRDPSTDLVNVHFDGGSVLKTNARLDDFIRKMNNQ